MFKIVPNPSFEAQVAITRLGEAKPGLITFTFKNLGHRELQAWVASSKDAANDAVWLGQVIEGWAGPVGADDQPLPYSEAALVALFDAFPAASQEVYEGYLKARRESRSGN